MPKKLWRVSAAMNGATALFWDELWHGATDYTAAYRQLDSFSVSQTLYGFVRPRLDTLRPGEEYEIVDAFAEILGLQGWYSWKVDPGEHVITDRSQPEE